MSSLPPGRSQPPVAVRVVRPFDSEDALLAAESVAFTRTGVVLVGAPSRPSGVVIRFEIALRDGASVMRGEGRVVGYRPPSSIEEAALLLRFTRLDVKSKTFLDHAVAFREAEKSGKPADAGAPIDASPSAPATHAVEPTPTPGRAPDHAVADAHAAAHDEPHDVVHELHHDDVHEVDATELAEETDHTVQAPPVALGEPTPKHPAPEHAPAPAPSPPSPPPVVHAPPLKPTPAPAPEHAPPVRKAPEHAPAQTPGKPHAGLDSEGRASALERLRSRAKKLKEMPSMFAEGERSSAADRASLEGATSPSAIEQSVEQSVEQGAASYVEGHERRDG